MCSFFFQALLTTSSHQTKAVQLFQPKASYRIFGGVSKAVGQGTNPRSGVTFDYYLKEAATDSTVLKLEVLENGKVIRTITSEKPKDFKSWPGGPSKPTVLPGKKGINRFTWNFNRDPLPAVDNVFVFGSYSGSSVAPGTYTLRLSQGDNQSSTEVTILPNPKIKASPTDYIEQQSLLTQIEATITDIHKSVNQMRSAKSQLESYAELLEEQDNATELLEKGEELVERIETWERNLIQPDQKTFQDVINFNNKLNAQLMYLKGFIDTEDPKVTASAKERFSDLMATWNTFKNERNAIINTEMEAYNTAFKALNIPAIILKD